MAEKSGNFSCHWPPRLFPGHCGPLSGGLSPAIVARSRQDSSACNLPILQAIGKFSLIKTAPVSANNPNQGWLYLGDISKVWARLDGHLWAAGQQLLSEAQMLGAPTSPYSAPMKARLLSSQRVASNHWWTAFYPVCASETRHTCEDERTQIALIHTKYMSYCKCEYLQFEQRSLNSITWSCTCVSVFER